MATENIVTGKKYRILKDATNKIWDVISFWGKAKDVEFDDGKNAETKLGDIQGITSSLVSDSSSIAASANAVKQLNDKITKLNSDIIDGGNEAVIASTTIYDYNGMYTDSRTIKRTIPQHSHGVCFKDIRVGLLVSFTVTVNGKLITNPEKAFEIPENAEVIVTFNVKNNKNETEVLKEWIFASAWLVYWY